MRVICVLSAFLLLSASAIAQAEKHLEFEVASVKPAAPDQRGMFIRPTPGGRLNITNMTLKELIVIAWNVQPYEISGGPPWLDSARYDITAKAENSFKEGELRRMLQSLLSDRFQLTIHRETKELPVYALTLARKDGKLGPGLTETKEGACTPPDPSKPLPPPGPGVSAPCGGFMMQVRALKASSIPIGQITAPLSRFLGRRVIDKTGLTGKYDINLEWTPDETQVAQMILPPDAPKPSVDPAGPSIFTAVQEQLGLKLESQKGPVEIIVIDRAEKPSEN
jgi:uncharacterized protein (TIGR03435 family)